jgi:Ca-activated chloride channel family protein
MKAAVRPEHHLLAVEREHDVNCMFELAVPAVASNAERPPLHVALVIDRSGSMAGEKLEHASRSAAWLGSRLRPADELALVTFDDEVRLVLPRTPVDADRLAAALASVRPGGTTNLSGGWLKGLEQLRSSPAEATRRILLLTDGMANAGITDGGALAALPRRAQADGVGTTTIGFGADFDEDLLTAMADSGGGNAHWAETPDMAPEIFAREFDGLTRLCAQNVSVEIRPSTQVEVLGILNEYPQVAVPGGVQVALGDAYGGETRNIVFQLHIPHLAELGAVQVAELILRYVTVGDEIATHEVAVPLVVNAVSAADAAAAAGDAEVRRQVLVLRAARARDEAIRMTDAGDADSAHRALRLAARTLREAGALDPLAAPTASAQADLLEDEAGELARGPMTPYQRKRLRYDSTRRHRGC